VRRRRGNERIRAVNPPAAMHSQTQLLFAGLAGVLVLASLVGWLLKRRVGFATPHATIDNLNARIKSWWLMVAVIGGAVWAGKPGTIALFAFASLLALREFITIAPTRRGDHKALLAGFALVLPVQYSLVWIEWYGMYTIFIPVYVFLFLPIVEALSSDTRNFLERAAIIQWALMISVFCISHVPALLMLEIPGYEGRNLLLLVFLVLVVQSSDVLQYI
jgi:phosphatidate cytidylyltransferase